MPVEYTTVYQITQLALDWPFACVGLIPLTAGVVIIWGNPMTLWNDGCIGLRVALCYHGLMSQPVKLSDALVLDARLTSEVTERSIAGQVEFWARLGRSVETLLRGEQLLTLSRNAALRPLSSCLSSVDSPYGRKRTVAWLNSQPFPHYEPHPTKRGLLIRTDEDGHRTVGRFVKRQFRPVRIATRSKAAG